VLLVVPLVTAADDLAATFAKLPAVIVNDVEVPYCRAIINPLNETNQIYNTTQMFSLVADVIVYT